MPNKGIVSSVKVYNVNLWSTVALVFILTE